MRRRRGSGRAAGSAGETGDGPDRTAPARPGPTQRALLTTLVPLLGLVGFRIVVEGVDGPVVPVLVGVCVFATALGLVAVRCTIHPADAGAARWVVAGAAVLVAAGLLATSDPRSVIATGAPTAVAAAWLPQRRAAVVAGAVGVWGAVLVGLVSALLPRVPDRPWLRPGESSAGPTAEHLEFLLVTGVTATLVLAAEVLVFVLVRLVGRLRPDEPAGRAIATGPPVTEADPRTGVADATGLAVARERLRFATDLHDLQEHTLVAIQRKAELARRSLDRDPETSARELRDIERLAADAAAGTRRLSAGDRGLSFDAELADFERLLSAAGMDVVVERDGRPDAVWDDLCGALLREAASNLLRHADAATVRVRVDATGVAVENDGARGATDDGGASGLDGLRRRFVERGGAFEAGEADGWFGVRGDTGAVS